MMAQRRRRDRCEFAVHLTTANSHGSWRLGRVGRAARMGARRGRAGGRTGACRALAGAL